MAMGAGSRGEFNSEINVTPLVDVMLVLLVVFMITAPLLTTGVDVDLPPTNAPVIESTEGMPILSIGKGWHLFFRTKEIKWSQLQTELEADPGVQDASEVWLEADKDLPYEAVVNAMVIARRAGIKKVQMLTDNQTEVTAEELDKRVSTAPQPADGN